jgi:ADP-ribosyl-[dinitrogen reductase] hydrolase
VTIDESRRWRISDDTQLTLATCQAIIQSGRIDPQGIAAGLAGQHRLGLTNPGASTYKALTELSGGGHWALVGRKGEMAAGNGAATRIAPLAFLLSPDDRTARRLIRDISRITHHSEEAYAGALVVLIAIRAAWCGSWKGETNLIELVTSCLPDTSVRDRLIEINITRNSAVLADIASVLGSSGYVVESVPLAVCAASRVRSLGFQAALEQLIRAGGDTDTNASIAGQIMGSLLGLSGLPETLVSSLPGLPTLRRTAEMFADAVGRISV